MSVRVLIASRLVQLMVGACLVVLAVIGIRALGAQAHGAPVGAHAAGASKGYTAKLSYDETNQGKQRGSALVGLQGHGTFSARLSAHAALEVAVIALATGVPVTKIAQGGTYSLQRDVAGNGDATGTAVATFKAHGLGTFCLRYAAKPGRFVVGQSFVPLSGTLTAIGGTGAAAHWQGSVKFKQTAVGGMTVEQFGVSGSEQGSTGKAKAMTAACKHVAGIPKH